jgi:uncharacterized protein YpmS
LFIFFIIIIIIVILILRLIKFNETIKKEKALNQREHKIKNQKSNEINNAKNDLGGLVDIYEFQLNEKAIQEASMLSLLNQNFTNISLFESEIRLTRDQLKKALQNGSEFILKELLDSGLRGRGGAAHVSSPQGRLARPSSVGKKKRMG